MELMLSKAIRLGNMVSIMHAAMRLILNRHMETTPSEVTEVILSKVMGVILSKVMGVMRERSTTVTNSEDKGVIISRACA